MIHQIVHMGFGESFKSHLVVLDYRDDAEISFRRSVDVVFFIKEK